MEDRSLYRNTMKAPDLCFFKVTVKQTDLYIGAEKDLTEKALAIVSDYRRQLEAYIQRHPQFLHSLVPIDPLLDAPLIAVDMCHAAKLAGVGPMAAVAGAVSKFVGQELARYSREILIENGGDLYLAGSRERLVGIYAGSSPLSGRLAVRIDQTALPCGVCTSSGTVGHSLSFGKADAAMVISRDASLADACATALGNRVKSAEDIEAALEEIMGIPGVTGCLVIIGKSMGVLGEVELVRT